MPIQRTLTELFRRSIGSTFGAAIVLSVSLNPALAEEFYVKTRGYRVEPAPEPPAYVYNLSKTPLGKTIDIDWLDVGLDFRTRYEYRENDYRPWVDTSSGTPVKNFRPDPDNLWLLRTRAYVGIHDILDPFRFAVELEDARSYNGIYEKSVADVNEFELIQGYGELYFNNALGDDRPLSVRVGRMHLELLDKRLIGNNQFRNTTNSFEGIRLFFGKKQNNWDLETFAFHPVERFKYRFDRADGDALIYGGVFSWRQWSKIVTIQPYLLGRKVDGDSYHPIEHKRRPDMDIYAPGLRIYGLFGESGFDFDADINKQFGRFGVRPKNSTTQTLQQHDALAYSLELGYTFAHDWKPRASVYYGFGTGDKSSGDNINQRLDIFYGFNQPFSRNDYFAWDNMHAPKLRLELTPHRDLRIDSSYGAFWLESETDAWSRANLRDSTGESGRFLGSEFDIRIRHHLNPYVDWSLSYAHFTPGEFTRYQAKADTGPYTSEPTNFFYFEVALNAFGDGKL